jgi:hypothetical protein
MSLRVYYEVLNQKGTPALYTDTLANRPAFGFQGRLFVSTDSGQIFEDTGTAWTLVADAGVGGGTLSSVCTNGNTTATGIIITAGGLSSNSITNTSNTAGSVLFAGTSGLESQSNATFFWDNTNKRLGIGNASPGASLDIHGTGTLIQLNGTTTNNSFVQFQNAGTSKWRIGNLYNAGANSFQVYDDTNTTARLTILNTGATTLNGTFTATSLIKSGGTSAEFLKADGSVDSNTYLTTSSASSTYLPLAGGTLTGALSGTSITGTSLVKSGGTSAQILAADGSVITAGTNITISSGTISASGGGSMAIGGSITSATAGSVLFAGASGVLAQSNAQFFWDNTNSRLGIGTNTIGSKLQVNGNAAIGYSASTAAPTNGLAVAGAGNFGSTVSISGTGGLYYNLTTTLQSDAALFLNDGTYIAYAGLNVASNVNHYVIYYNGATRMAINASTGNLGIGTNTIGSKLQVNGNAAIGYSASTAAPTNGLAVSGSVAIGTSTAAQKLSIVTSGGSPSIYLADGTTDCYLGIATTAGGYASGSSAGDIVLRGTSGISFSSNGGSSVSLRIASTGVAIFSTRVNTNNSTDNALFSLSNNGTTNTVGLSPTALAVSTNTYTILTSYTSIFYTGTGVATWTLPNPSGTNQIFWIKNAGTGVITLNAFAGTNIINNSAASVTSITIAVGATVLIQQDGNVKSYQLQ